MSLTPNVLHVSVQNASGLRSGCGRTEDTRSECVAPASAGGARRTSDGCGSSGIRTVDDRLPQTVGPRGRARHQPRTDAAPRAGRVGDPPLDRDSYRHPPAAGAGARQQLRLLARSLDPGGKAGPASAGQAGAFSQGTRWPPLTIGRGREPTTRASVADPAPARSIRAGGSSEPPVTGAGPRGVTPGPGGSARRTCELRHAERRGSPRGPQG
jgi:hypothetical protein